MISELGDCETQTSIPIADANALFQRGLANGKNYDEVICLLIEHSGDYGHYSYFLH